jgi:hypothetical protein
MPDMDAKEIFRLREAATKARGEMGGFGNCCNASNGSALDGNPVAAEIHRMARAAYDDAFNRFRAANAALPERYRVRL